MDSKSPDAFRTISEVADWLGVPAHVLRFWESRFGQVKPVKRAGGRRYYRPSDMELLGGIRKLLHEDGMTIRGVQKLLREKGVKYVAAMSPPIDVSAATMEIGATETEAPEVAGTSPMFETEVEDAELSEAPLPPPFDTEVAGGADAAASDPDAGVADAAMFAEPATGSAAQAARRGDGEPETGAPAAPRPMFADAPADQPQGEPAGGLHEGPHGAPEDGTADGTEGLFDGPEAIDFFAHEAEPDSREGADDDATLNNMFADAAEPDPASRSRDAALRPAFDGAPDSDAEAAAPPRAFAPFAAPPDASAPAAPQAAGPGDTPAADIAKTPAAEDVEPVGRDSAEPDRPAPDEPGSGTGEAPGATTLDAPVSFGDVSGADAAATAGAPAARGTDLPQAEATPPAAVEPAPATERLLAMPEIGPDPEDDADIDLAPVLVTELRRHRAGSHGVPLNPVALQALADRLDALSGRLGRSPEGRRPF